MTELSTAPPGPPEPGPAKAAALSRLTTWLSDRPRAELYAYLGLIALAFALRIFDLGSRPFHHDESQDAYFSWVFYDRGDYHYQPLLHGPLRFYLTGLVYLVFGDSDFTARLAPAVMGTIAVGLPYLLRRQLGGLAAFTAGALLAVGPTYLYFSRFAREDIYIAAITLGLMIALLRYLDRPRRGVPPIIAALIALSFATKESTWITGLVITTFLVPAVVIQSLQASSWKDGQILRAVRAVGWAPWGYALATFALVYALMFTVFFTDPSGIEGLYTGLDYWLSQQPVARGGEPWYFYLAVLFGEEWPALLLGLIGAVWVAFHPTTQRLFVIWWFAGSLAVYSWASERFAWLAMHPLLPLLLLSGLGVQAIWRARSRALRAGGMLVVAAGLAYAGYASFLVNAKHGADPVEWLVSTQSSVATKRVAMRVLEIDERVRRRNGAPVTITVDSGQGATFPWAWYFRHLAVGYIDFTTPNYTPNTQVLIMTEEGRAAVRPNLAAYDGQRFDFRIWWVRDWTKKLSVDAWLKWFTERKTWNPTGGMKEWFYVRKDAEAAAP